MKTTVKILCLILLPFLGFGQQIEKLKNELSSLKRRITNQQADSLIFKNYDLLLWFYSGTIDAKPYPMAGEINEQWYKNNIVKLLADTGKQVNTLACLMAASANDTSKIPLIEEVLKSANYKNMLVAKSLLMLDSTAIDPISKCLVVYGFDEMVQYLMIDFLRIDKHLLEKFARDSLFSKDKGMQFLAVKAMAEFKPEPTNENLLRQAVFSYDTLMKGWPIAVLAKYKAPRIYDLVKFYVNKDELRDVSLRALMASDDLADVEQIYNLLRTEPIDKAILDNLLNSGKNEYLRQWLILFDEQAFPNHYFFVYNKDLSQPKYFNIVASIIEKNDNPSLVENLMRFFEENGGKYHTFLKKCLNHRFNEVRTRAAALLKQ